MKWFLIIFFVHISQYGSSSPDNIKFIKVDKQYNSMRECQMEARKEIIKLIKEFDFKYDWKVAKCTDSQFTSYLYPDAKKKIEQEKDYEVYSIKTKTIN